MDRLDLRILRELIQGQATSPLDPNFRKSYRTIARVVGVDEHTVRNRVKRFHETGFIQDWRCVVNPRLGGAGAVAAWFDVPPGIPKGDLVEQLRLVPDVYLVVRFLGSLMSVVFLVRTEASARSRLELLRRMSKAERVNAGRDPFPPCGDALSEADRKILQSLSRHPRRPYAAISKDVGLSSRTVKRKLDRLSQQGVVFAFPSLNPKALTGSAMAAVMVTYPSDRKEALDREIAIRLDPYLWHVFHMFPFEPGDVVPCHFNVMLPNPAVIAEIRRWLRRLEGLGSARVELFEEVHTMYEPFETLMEDIAGRARVAIHT